MPPGRGEREGERERERERAMNGEGERGRGAKEREREARMEQHNTHIVLNELDVFMYSQYVSFLNELRCTLSTHGMIQPSARSL